MSGLPDWNLQPEQWLLTQNKETYQLLDNPLLKKDVWRTVEDLGLKNSEHRKLLSLTFEKIEQDWLKLLAKLYTLIRSQRKLSTGVIRSDLGCLVKFSRFLERKSIFSPENINDELFEEYEHYLKSSKLATRTISHNYTALINFFDLCRIEGWLEVSTYWFRRRCKRVKPNNDDIEYIPEEVWNQLTEHLHYLPEQNQRMVILLKATGFRIGELLTLPLDCLRKRNEQWRIRLTTEKYREEDEIPIVSELVVIIQEQQEFVREHFGDSYRYLFGSYGGGILHKPVPRVMSSKTFSNRLNLLAREHNIRTKEGEIWHFKSHQFRKTFLTVMTNAGVRDLIIQKYARHRSPDMQDYYKHLFKKVLGDEYDELMKETKYVDSTGKIVAVHKPKDPLTEFTRRRMYPISTMYGECHRPLLKQPCQTVNACSRCEYWRTSTNDLPYLKQDLERVENELEIATRLKMVRQQQGLAGDRERLLNRIQGLEASHD